ncbi:hypothetical protein ADK94_19470 [Streptomyces sp. XY593]|nr:hypothetical protein ADK49_09905 [Streptomyces sp. WM6349]KOU84015.1 hypothetical protein ADK94_19470 [Streptomyces sp. XY593]KOU95420.1 hypothetical protein ADK92_20835 [Streptomyces sp. XY533]KOV15661.1 hypothetical protein ADK91_05920 [Streptomyces sp. XY511]KOV47288.1 hypothetical protein ADK98_11210 [Streptomyces sp. H036]
MRAPRGAPPSRGTGRGTPARPRAEAGPHAGKAPSARDGRLPRAAPRSHVPAARPSAARGPSRGGRDSRDGSAGLGVFAAAGHGPPPNHQTREPL